MKLYTEVLIALLGLIAIPDIFFYLKLKDANARPIYIILHLIFPVLFTAAFLYIKFESDRLQNFRMVVWMMWFYFIFIIIYIPKIIHIIFYVINKVYIKLFKHENIYIAVFRIGITIFVVLTMLIGAYVTPREFEIDRVKVTIRNLPEKFNGYKIVQISDIHLGSWNKKYRRLIPMVNMINNEKADIIVFSGDMVNNFADETSGWAPYLKNMKAKHGKFAVLGNHDYGDYTDWKSEHERTQNRLGINQAIRDFGFRLLLNESTTLTKNEDSILLVGVENWGKNSKYRYSNLNKALKNSRSEILKIVIAHDPNQWEAEIIGKEDIVLTLSGHTHAGQIGIKIGSHILSPASLAFKNWAGLYKTNNQYLYVNKGIGYIGLPMHIGIRPEITVIELYKK